MPDLRTIVFRNLDHARENGFFDPGEQLHGADADTIVDDLRAYAQDCYDQHENALRPHVVEWLILHPQTLA